MGGSAFGDVRHRDQQPPHTRRGQLHPRRLQRGRPVRLRRGGRCGQRRGSGARSDAPNRLGWRHTGLRVVRRDPRQRLRRGPDRPAPRPGHAVFVRYHRPAQGHQGTAAGRAGERDPRPVHGGVLTAVRVRPGMCVPVPGSAVSRCAAALLRHGQLRRGHDRADGQVRRRRCAQPHRRVPGHPQPVGAHDVHPHAQTARGCPRQIRRQQHEDRNPRGSAVSSRGQAGHDQVVGPGDPRVLRLHRGCRRHVHQQRGSPDPPRFGGQTPAGCGAHLRRRRQRTAHGRDRHGLLGTRRTAVRVSQRSREDEVCAAPRAPGLDNKRRCRLRRRGGFPLSHRP